MFAQQNGFKNKTFLLQVKTDRVSDFAGYFLALKFLVSLCATA
jgi:hypothetical protein